MNNTKPILPNSFKIDNRIIIEYRIEKKFDVEIYKLTSGKFLYLFLDLKPVSESKMEKYKMFNINIRTNTYKAFVSKEDLTSDIKTILEDLTTLRGFDAVAGMKDLKTTLIKDVIMPITQKDKYKAFKLSIPNGIMLYGPPGCGKTYIVRKLAEEIGYDFIEIKHSDVTTPYIHGGVGKISEVFSRAKAQAPCIVFVDEIDGLLPDRTSLSGNQDYKLEEVNEFLMHLNDAGKNDILVIGATNKIELIDEAVLRSGRFDKKIYVMPPDYDARIALFKMYLSERPIKDLDYESFAGQTVNYACSDIEYICDEASRKTVVLGKDFIDNDIVLETISEIKSSIEKSDI